MKTKPDGYIGSNWRHYLNQPGGMTEIHATNTHYDNTICLVKPSTCDKVRELIAYTKPSADRYHSQLIDELLKLLPEVGE